ncbi:MAG: O-antigen ligase family protein [Gemmatimonadota bacterium]
MLSWSATHGDPEGRQGPCTSSTAFYLVLLPLTQWWVIPVAGIRASGADLLLTAVLGGALVKASTRGFRRRLSPGEWTLVAFGIWVMASASWSLHPDYAAVRGVATLSLALGVVALSRTVASRESAMDAWLWGTALLLAVSLPLAVAASWVPALDGGILYRGGGVEGLPFSRLRGPLAHPNLLGDYLLVSGCILYIRWEEWYGSRRPIAVAMAVGGSGALLLTASSAWLALGSVLALVAWRHTRRPWRTRAGSALSGMVLAAAVLFTASVAWALTQPMAVKVPWGTVSTDGNRWGIWSSAWQAVRTAPFMGVGSSPYLAETFHPYSLWDAHSTYLSVAGQYGLVGLLLLLAGVGRLWWESRRLSPLASQGRGSHGSQPPAGWAPTVGLALLAAAVHGLVISGEDFRHHWALLALLAMRPGGPIGGGRVWKGAVSGEGHTGAPGGKTG